MKRLLCLILFSFTACGDNHPSAPDAPATPDAFTVAPGTVGAAELAIAAAACRYLARCTGGPSSTCATSSPTLKRVEDYCGAHDCAAAYPDWSRLDACVASYDQIACMSTAPTECAL